MEYKRISNLITYGGKLIEEFSEQTGSFAVDFEENKNYAEWSMNYNLIKIQFVFTKKEKLLVPACTLFCRIYLGKNDVFFYHIPELIEYLDDTDFKCYYFPYIESEKRMKACFEQLALFLKKHMKAINAIAVDSEKCTAIKTEKLSHIQRLSMGEKSKDKDMESFEEMQEFWIDSYERYVLLLRFAAEGCYREFLRGNYQKAIVQYEKMRTKGQLTSYEERLLAFIKALDMPFEAIPEECDSVLEAREFNGSLKDGLAYLYGVFLCELVFGAIGCAIVMLFNIFLSRNTLVFCGLPWYWGLIAGGLPAVFGSIALRRTLARFTRKGNYEKAMIYDEIMNSKNVSKFANIVFGIAIIFALVITVVLSVCSTGFYEDRLVFNDGEEMISFEMDTCYYKDLDKVIYSEGVYNDFGDFIDRPSYLLTFEDGTVWDSDGFTSVEVVEEEILPILEGYYDEIHTVEARNEFIE